MSWISEVTSILATQAVTNDLVVSAFETALDIDVSHGKRITALEERLAALEKPPAPTLPTVSEWIGAQHASVGYVDRTWFSPLCGDGAWRSLPMDVYRSLCGVRESGDDLWIDYPTPADARAALADALIRLGKARPDMPEPK